MRNLNSLVNRLYGSSPFLLSILCIILSIIILYSTPSKSDYSVSNLITTTFEIEKIEIIRGSRSTDLLIYERNSLPYSLDYQFWSSFETDSIKITDLLSSGKVITIQHFRNERDIISLNSEAITVSADDVIQSITSDRNAGIILIVFFGLIGFYGVLRFRVSR